MWCWACCFVNICVKTAHEYCPSSTLSSVLVVLTCILTWSYVFVYLIRGTKTHLISSGHSESISVIAQNIPPLEGKNADIVLCSAWPMLAWSIYINVIFTTWSYQQPSKFHRQQFGWQVKNNAALHHTRSVWNIMHLYIQVVPRHHL